MAALTDLQLDDLNRRLAAAGVVDLRPLAGGASSLTFAGMRGDRRVVVKVAPPGVEPILHRDVLRQSRVIRALGPTAVPVPEVLWEDRGDPPDVPPLFIMSFLDGDSLEPLFDLDAAGGQPTQVAERLRDAARAMARLHRLEPTRLGLGTETITDPSQEIQRWYRLLETVDPTLVPGWQDVAAQLRSSIPAALPPAVVHGDFRLGNLRCVGDRVTAVIDWEIWSLGDPRVDAGWFLINADPATYGRQTPYRGSTPSPTELAAIYAAALGREVPDLPWFQGLACFKSAATWSLIVKHNRRRSTPVHDVETMATHLPALLARAASFLTHDAPETLAPKGGY
ncbi:MAG: phosphotransferase family protein [Mycobacterium sp.]|uniref:phosphotransferase family protein n=1 Tax=Mycobacterium sp. TaxID=1785 RepID=UPI003F9D8CC6